MAVTHIIYLMDGTTVGATSANLDHIKKTLSNVRAAGARIGDKVISRNLLAGVSTVGVINEQADSNMELMIGNFKLYFKVPDQALSLHTLEQDLASQDFVMINGEALFNRNVFQYFQPAKDPATVPEASTTE